MDQGKQPAPASITVWTLLCVAVLFMLSCGGLWGYVLMTRPAAVRKVTLTPIFVVITPDRTRTPAPIVATIRPDGSSVNPSATFPPPPVGSLIKVGAYVQVEGTGDGLRLRYEPGLDSEVNYLAFDYEVFLVEDGPRQVDDLQWWFLASQSDKTRNGWGAANYLQVIR